MINLYKNMYLIMIKINKYKFIINNYNYNKKKIKYYKKSQIKK